MAAVPVWFTTGQGTFAVVMVSQTVAADGTLSDNSSQTYTAQLDDVELDFQVTTEDIRPLNTLRANHVITGDDYTLTLTEILKNNGTNLAATAFAASAIFKLTITRGPQAYGPVYGVRSGYNEGLKNGKSVGRLTMACCGIAPTYA